MPPPPRRTRSQAQRGHGTPGRHGGQGRAGFVPGLGGRAPDSVPVYALGCLVCISIILHRL